MVVMEEEAMVVMEEEAMEVEDMEVEAMEVEDMEEEAMVVMEEEAMVVEHTIPREAKEADIIPPILTPTPMLPYPNILAIARKNANECGNIVVVLFHTSFVKEASFLNRMNYLHGKVYMRSYNVQASGFYEEI